MKRGVWLIPLFLGLFVLDFLLKYWVHNFVLEPIVVFRSPFGVDFLIQCVTNRGGAWGMLSSFQIPLLLFRIGIAIGLSIYLFFYCQARRVALFITLVITGALGNIFDFFYYGYVVDMLHFTFWGRSYGIFNLADAMIFSGAVGLIFSTKKSNELSSF